MTNNNRMHVSYFFDFKSSRREAAARGGQGLWACAMGLLACLLIAAFAAPSSAYGANPVNAYITRVFQLVHKQREELPRLITPANATAKALIAGGKFYLGGDKGWVTEGSYRAGGVMMIRALSAKKPPVKGDVVWLAYEPSTYQQVAQQARELERRGCLVVVFGPKPASGAPHFKYWLDSFTPLNADNNFTRMGNVLSLWTLTGELAASTARMGKTLVFYESIFIYDSTDRHNMYKDMAFHDGVTHMAPVRPGVISEEYLAYIQNMLENIREWELTKIVAVGKKMARLAAEGHPALLTVIGHVMPSSVDLHSKLYRYVDTQKRGNPLEGELHRGGFLVFVGYQGTYHNVWRDLRKAGATAAWIIAPFPAEVYFSQWGDVMINQHWPIGDCAVEVPGYDIRILPPSGIAQLFIYGTMMRAAGAR